MIDLRNGLQFSELLEIAKYLNVTKLLSPDLHKQLLDGTNSLLAMTSALQNIPPWLLNFIPGNIGGQVDGGIKALQLVKSLMEA
jgi:hypothetical protein